MVHGCFTHIRDFCNVFFFCGEHRFFFNDLLQWLFAKLLKISPKNVGLLVDHGRSIELYRMMPPSYKLVYTSH